MNRSNLVGDGGPGGQYGGAPGGQYPPPYGPQKRGNGFAIAGIILAILLWPLGLIFAIIGLVKSRARAGAGKVLSIVAIVVGVVVGAVSISLVAIAGNSTAADPGCISAENSFQSMMNKISSDDSAMSADANNPAKERADIKGFTTDAQTLVAKLNAAEAEATHQSVKSAVGKASSDMSAMLSALQAVENGHTSQISVLDNKANSLSGDGTAIDNICSSF
jgi:vacuolar-type H+-ATPase subunit H